MYNKIGDDGINNDISLIFFEILYVIYIMYKIRSSTPGSTAWPTRPHEVANYRRNPPNLLLVPSLCSQRCTASPLEARKTHRRSTRPRRHVSTTSHSRAGAHSATSADARISTRANLSSTPIPPLFPHGIYAREDQSKRWKRQVRLPWRRWPARLRRKLLPRGECSVWPSWKRR